MPRPESPNFTDRADLTYNYLTLSPFWGESNTRERVILSKLARIEVSQLDSDTLDILEDFVVNNYEKNRAPYSRDELKNLVDGVSLLLEERRKTIRCQLSDSNSRRQHARQKW